MIPFCPGCHIGGPHFLNCRRSKPKPMNASVTRYKCPIEGCNNYSDKHNTLCETHAAPSSTTGRQRLLLYMEEKTAKMVEICKAKNSDYAGASSDPFANFTRVESLGICKTEVGFLTRMTDKLCRIASFVAKGTLAVKDESVEDTLLDLANYCLLFGAYLAEKRRGGGAPSGGA